MAILALFTGLLAVSPGLQADELRLQASVDRTQVAVGDYVTLTVSVSAEGAASEPELAVPDGFNTLGRTSSSSTSISIVNGQMTTTRTISFIYTLEATREGSFVIGPARVVYKGQAYTSSRVRVDVVKGGSGRQARPAPEPGQSMSAQDIREIEENLFIAAEPDRKRVYVGEQVTLSYKLYTRYNLHNVRYGNLPTYTEFWVEPIFEAKRLDPKREVVDGRAFNVSALKTVGLFPTSAGKHSLEQLEVVCEIPVRSRRRSVFDFDDFFDFDPFGQTRSVVVRSEDVEIEVLPLPPGAPSGFGGAVGQFRISAEASPATVAAGDPVSLTVTVSGTGNLNAIAEPARPEGDAFRFYDPKATVETEVRGGRVGGRKKFEYVVIPQRAGQAQIPPFRLVHFDPQAERYLIAQSAPIRLAVTPGKASSQPAAPVLSRSEIEVLGEDIRYLKPDLTSLEDQGRALYADWRFLALQVLPALGFLGALFYKRHRDRLMRDVAYARRRRSGAEARRRLARARELLRTEKNGMFYAEINQALARFLADRLNLPPAGLTPESAAQALSRRGVPREVVQEVKAVFQQCDFARFAPAQAADADRERLYEATEELIDELGGRI